MLKNKNIIVLIGFWLTLFCPAMAGNTFVINLIIFEGSGQVICNGTTIPNYGGIEVNEGSSLNISFVPRDGYKIKSVIVRYSDESQVDVTSQIRNNQYTIKNVTDDMFFYVAFEPFSLTITTSGNGKVSYYHYNSGTPNYSIRNETATVIYDPSKPFTFKFIPDKGYHIAFVKENNIDVTANVSDGQYTIENINADTHIEVAFEPDPSTTYILSITASGYGSATYNGTSARNQTRTFTVNEGTSATVSFSPDNGYRIASVKMNSTDVTSKVQNNQYIVSNITANTTVSVSFEAIPQTTYTLSITASGYGSATYNGTSARNQTRTFTVNEGASATVSFSPDNGYRIASVKVNNADVTGASVTSNRYTISNINANTTVSVTFEAIPPTTHSLSIKVSGNGYVLYNDTYFRNKTNYYTVSHGSSETIAINPDAGNRLSNMKVNNKDVTSNVKDNSYTITNITTDTNVEVTFEETPPTTFSLSITASGNGSVTYDGTTSRNQTRTFTVNEGSSASISFSPDNGYRIGSVKVNNADVTSSIANNQYTVSNIKANTTVTVTFVENEYSSLTNDGVNYRVVSNSGKTVNVANGSYGYWLMVPATFTANGFEWSVTGIDNDVLSGNPQLAAVIWNPSVQFTANVSNPNFLLYVTSSQYAPSSIKNVVVGNTANSITLTDASSGNNFYCPREFTAKQISYSHSFGMTTGINEARGWESIALPFDVEAITHTSKGNLVPFGRWQEGSNDKPFWLCELSSSGFAEANAIKANTPYIISMPNNAEYKDEYRVAGTITFSSTDVKVKSSESLQNGSYSDRTFVPNFINQNANSGFYVLNAANSYVTNTSSYAEGSRFIKNLRAVHPFEAYIASANNAKEAFPIFEDTPTWIQLIENSKLIMDRVYNLSGQQVKIEGNQNYGSLKKGIYIVNGKKIVVR